ncbi:Ig-like domain repeat protein [Hyalangium gracile]|uniref:Ig-like domain repeat protein n=1 Tax=Hyalangium gracile TaxID=394092 RepID=UPI001CCB2247|nr:Ig-like domain repeat protein [Hyalangium gracile]
MRRAVWQWLLVGFALVWGASGCNCGEPPVESQLEVAFDRPKDGDRLSAVDDADPATDGFQYEVVAVARDTADRPLKLASAKLEVRGPNEQTWNAGPEAVIDGATVRFPGTLLQPRTNLLQVTVEEAGSRRTATQRISVTVAPEPPSVDLTQPAEGQVLREKDDADPDTAGYQLHFSLRSSGLAGKAGTLYCENACGVPPTDFTVNSSGLTQVSVTLTQSACEAQQAACYAVVRNGTQEVTSSKRNIQLDTVAPRVELASPVAPVTSTTFKVEATVGCTEPGVVATLSREGMPDMPAQVVGRGVTFPAVTVPTDGQYTFTLRVADEGGNVTTRQIPVTVASTPPTLKLVVPKTITSDTVDGRLDNGLQATVSVQADSLPVGTEVRLFTSVNSQFARPQRAVTATVGGNRVATFTAQLAEGTNPVQACVSNAAGLEQCAAESVTVSTSRPVCRIITPLAGALTRTSPTEVQVESGAGPVTVVAYDLDGMERGRVSGTASSGSARVSMPLAADGEYRLVASCPGGGTSQALSLGVDTTAPALSFNVHGLPTGQTTLGPELNDSSLSPGIQVSLDVTTEPRASVLATGCGMTVGVAGQADASGALLLRDVSVPDSGTCELRLTSTDPAGNVTTTTQALTLVFAGSSLRFVSPQAGRYLGATDGVIRDDGGLLVSVGLEVGATAAGTLRLLRGTTEIASLPVAANETRKTFTNVALEDGANVLRAELTGPGGTVACATILLLVDTEPGNITLIIPTTAPDPYKVSLDAAPALSGIQAQLQYSAPNRSPSAVVDICTSVALVQGATPCRDGSGWFTLAANVPPSVPNFTYPDGRYALKAVLDDGAISVSQEVTLRVDSVEPVVRSVELLGDTNGDKRLNAEELPTGAPQLQVAVDGLEDGSPVQVRDLENRNVIYGEGRASGGRATVSLTAMPTGVADDYSVVVTVTDAAGNQNRVDNDTVFYPLNTAARFSFVLDRVLPVLVLTSPTRTSLGKADDASTAGGFQLSVTVNTAADVGTGGVHMELSPAGEVVDLTPASLVARHDFTLPETGKVTYTLTVTATDTSGNRSAAVVRTLTVDQESPTVTLVTPTEGTYDSTEVPVQVDVGGGDVGSVSVFSQVGSSALVLIGNLPVVSGVAQGTLNFPIGLQTVSVQASDAAGNTASDSEPNVEVRQAGCDITLTAPASAVATLLAKDDQDPSTPGLQYRVKGNSQSCRGAVVSLYRGTSTTPEATTTVDPVTAGFLFDVTLADGEQTRLTVEIINVSSIRTIDYADVTVDITPPLITSISPTPTTLYFVASSNAYLFPTPAPDRVVDGSPGRDADATFTLTVAQGVGSKVQAFYRGVPVSAERPVVLDPETLPVPVTLPHDTVGTLELRVQDASGNVALHTVAATVDVIPPTAPTVSRTLVAGQERAAKVNVSWTASGDDELSGMPAGYDLRWTVNAQLKNGITDENAFASPKVKQETGSLLPATSTSYELTLPPLASYSIQLRPRDEVGNYPPFQVADSALIPNFWTTKTLNNPGASTASYGLYITSRGDLNADGFDDLVVGASFGTPGAAYIYYGSNNPQVENRQDLTLPEGGNQFYGGDFDVGDAGNPTADRVQDLLISARGYSSTSGRAFLYFGRKGTTVDTTGAIEFRLPTSINNASLGGTAKMIGDITGDGLQEIILSSHGENPPKAYMFYGRSPDEWRALGSGCNASSACVVPASSANKIFSAPAGTSFFGRNRGYVRLGDITGDGVTDFTIPSSHETQNKVYVYSGATVRSLPGSAVSISDALQVLSQPTGATATNGFGTEAAGGVDLAGGPGLDLVVSMAVENKVFVYRDGNAQGFTTSPLLILGGSRFGTALARGDLNGDGRPDIAIGQNLQPGGSAYVFYNRGVPGAEFDTVAEDGFFQSKLESNSSFGISLSILDYNGDGKPDLAVGDHQSSPARVVVYY